MHPQVLISIHLFVEAPAHSVVTSPWVKSTWLPKDSAIKKAKKTFYSRLIPNKRTNRCITCVQYLAIRFKYGVGGDAVTTSLDKVVCTFYKTAISADKGIKLPHYFGSGVVNGFDFVIEGTRAGSML